MKTLVVILLAGIWAAFISSCNNTDAKETGIKKEVASTKEATGNIISYKVNGELVTTSAWNISRFKLTNASNESLNITSNMHDEKRTINININGTEPGEHGVKTDDKSGRNFYGSYFPDYVNDVSNNYSFETGVFIITKIDTVKNILEGSFWGTVKNLKGETLDISDGKIVNGRLTAGVTIYE